MARELAISLYFFVFKCLFSIFSIWPLKGKTTFVISFGDNSEYIFKEMLRQQIKTEIVFLCKGKSIEKFKGFSNVSVISFETYHILQWIEAVYHLATSRTIFIDNYFGFLAAVQFKAGVQCIQLWHASGALKKFGLEDESIKHRTKRAKQRFIHVYSKFDKVIVGSDIMAEIFKKSFNLNEEKILRTGIPRTDFFFNEQAKQQVLNDLYIEFPQWKQKKIILYAPTYRDEEVEQFSLQLDIKKMNHELGNDYIIILRLHPAIQMQLHNDTIIPGFAYDCSSDKYEINQLLLIADILITDYSSIPFEFSLLRRPMIFFTYDLEEYREKRGILEGFEAKLPGPIAKGTDEVIRLLKENRFNLEIVNHYAERWNKYSVGHSSENVVLYVFANKTLHLPKYNETDASR
ncbi:CDP-glycerol glycerophosphotransferase family protein [Bacillus rubiinfantis]|uniref:CDP-glycerol glycerophosphotransferase family protein n=1 Tax=Bacillus rubiinfantis TaxID=1499680 RepID=UPI0005AB5E66|nr:CDP-glycerol glycerophosphotransferase family protein [Bacillus rubiinfantis]